MKFFRSNDPFARLARTIIQGVIGVVIANLDVIIGNFTIPDVWKPILTMAVMAVLAPIMSLMGGDPDE